MFKWFKKNYLILSSLALLIFIVYTNSLSDAFVSDDIAEIVNNKALPHFSYVTSHFYGFIRPLTNYLIFHLFGLTPFFFRLVNIFWHIGCTWLVFALISYLYNKRWAVLTALLFAVHPLLSEPITWVSGGLYPQYTFFFLLSLYLYILSQKSVKWYLPAVVAYMMSVASHVSSLMLIPTLTIYEIAFGNLLKNWKRLVPFLAVSLIYGLFVYSTLGERETTLSQVHYQERGVDNVLITVPIAISSYLQLFVWPDQLTIYHSELSFQPVGFTIRAIIFLIYVGLIIYGFFKNRFLFFWLSLIIISLLPTLTPFRLTWIVAERYIYLGSLGFFLVMVWLIDKLSLRFRKKWGDFYGLALPVAIAFAVLIIALSARTIIRNTDWHTEDSLWIATGKTSPSSPNNHNNLGDVYGRHGDTKRSIQEFQTAIALKPNYADAYHNLGNAYRDDKQIDKALQSYQKAAELNPRLWQSYQNMAAIYFDQGKLDLSLQAIQTALKINPQNPNLLMSLGVVYYRMGNKDKAKQALNQAISLDPENAQIRAALLELSK